jgi:hypothetical protein
VANLEAFDHPSRRKSCGCRRYFDSSLLCFSIEVILSATQRTAILPALMEVPRSSAACVKSGSDQMTDASINEL